MMQLNKSLWAFTPMGELPEPELTHHVFAEDGKNIYE